MEVFFSFIFLFLFLFKELESRNKLRIILPFLEERLKEDQNTGMYLLH
jgi:hypothetical protein